MNKDPFGMFSEDFKQWSGKVLLILSENELPVFFDIL